MRKLLWWLCMKIGNTIKELRCSKGLLQEELANIMSINRVQLSQYENDYNTIPIKHLLFLSDYFHISIDYLIGINNCCYELDLKKVNYVLAGQRLKEFRKIYKITQSKLAIFLNTTQAVIANYERGRNLIATPFLYEICKKYNVSADYLLGRIDYIPEWCNEKKN